LKRSPNKNKNKKDNKVSSDMRPVSDLKIDTLQVYTTHYYCDFE